MATLRDIRQRISAVKNTVKITSAMKMVAAAKLRRAQDAITSARPYATKLSEVLSNLASSDMDFIHPFFDKREEVGNVLVIVVSSDRGLCGAFNANLFRVATQTIETNIKKQYPKAKVHLISIGKRAVSFFSKRNYNTVASLPDVFAKLNFETVLEIAPIVTEGFINGTYDRVHIIFNEFKSVIRQEVQTVQLLPVESTKKAEKAKSSVDYIYEPSREEILENLLPKYLNLQIWRALLDSNAAEQAARMMAMDNATTNAKDLINVLQLEYNKARQAAITKEMLEIVGGAEALKGA
jgi:F-type H+-transporting ATPase subunit gamma